MTEPDLPLEMISALSRGAVEISAARTVPGCFLALEKVLREQAGFPLVQVFETDAQGKTCWVAGLPAERGQAELDPSLVQWALKGSRPILEPWEKGAVSGQIPRSVVLLSLRTHERPYGLALLWASAEPAQFNGFLLDALESFGRVVAFTIDHLSVARRNQELRELMDNVLESVPHAILAIGRDDVVLACNRNLEFLFQVSRPDIVGRAHAKVFPQKFSQVLESLTLASLEGQETSDFEYEHQVDEKTALHVGITSNLIAGPEAPLGVVFILRDLSLSREVTKLRELDEMKSTFVHTVSHELKTPLTAILGGAEMLAQFSEGMGQEQRELVRIVDAGAKRLHLLISDLLDLSRLESGRIHLEPIPTDLTALVQEVALLVQTRNPRNPIRFEIPPLLPQPEVDRAKIRQVLENFLSNAMKYSPNSGEVIVKMWLEGEEVLVEVIDSGMGIPEKHLPHIWDKFYRVDTVSRSQIEGTGLGLAIVKHIVEMHGGRVWVRSREGLGSTFGFAVPV